MIYGIGTDLVEIARLSALLNRRGERAARRILAPAEWGDFQHNTQQDRLLAKRFAAKEAFAKALGTGLRTPVLLSAMAVMHDTLGRPILHFSEELTHFCAQRGVGRCFLSLSDERAYVLAFVTLECVS